VALFLALAGGVSTGLKGSHFHQVLGNQL